MLSFRLTLCSQSPDGTRVYLCSGDAVRSFCTVTGAPIGAPLLGHTGDVTSVAFHPSHPSGQVLLTASLDGTLRAWSAIDGSPVGTPLTATGPVESMAVPGGMGGGKGHHGGHHPRDVVFLSCWRRRETSEGVGASGGGGGAVRVPALASVLDVVHMKLLYTY